MYVYLTDQTPSESSTEGTVTRVGVAIPGCLDDGIQTRLHLAMEEDEFSELVVRVDGIEGGLWVTMKDLETALSHLKTLLPDGTTKTGFSSGCGC